MGGMVSRSTGEWEMERMAWIELLRMSKLAKSKGLSVAVSAGKVQLTVVTFAKNGTSTITYKTGPISVAEAMAHLKAI